MTRATLPFKSLKQIIKKYKRKIFVSLKVWTKSLVHYQYLSLYLLARSAASLAADALTSNDTLEMPPA